MNIFFRINRKLRHIRRESIIRRVHAEHRTKFELEYGRVDEIINYQICLVAM